MCNFKQCIYSITELLHEENERSYEIFLFCSFFNCLPEDIPPGCSASKVDSLATYEPFSDCTQSSVEPCDEIPF